MYTQEEHEKQKRELWVKMLIAYAGSSNSTRYSVGAEWADKAVKSYDDRYKPKEPNEKMTFTQYATKNP